MLNMLLWNVINLIDGEASWFLTFLFILTLASVATHGWRWLSAHLQKKFIARNEPLKNATIQASVLPVSCYIWFITAIECLDLISDRFLSESLSHGLKFIFGVSAVLTMAWFLLRVNSNIRKVLLEKSKKREIALDPGKVSGITKLASVAILLLSAFILMEVTGMSVNSLLALGGIGGLAVAFASQEIIANFFSGIMIHVNQPFALGDLIHLPNAGIEGTVEDIGWYETCLRSRDKQPVYIPNALFAKAYVINSTRRTHRQIIEKISIRHQDLAASRAIIESLKNYLNNNSSIDTSQKTLVYIGQVAPYSIDITVNCLSNFVDEAEFLEFRDDFLLQTASIIKANGAEIAIPLEGIISLDGK
ncbi:MAG: mechanosensitive ion channel family protein [Chlamydiales bacterium]|nr:mechanosensitive ion channel family protein [Chlamydiales bacterium]